MTQPGRVRGEVAVVELGVAAALAHDLHVREAEAHAVDAYEHVIGIGLGHGDQLRATVLAQVLLARAPEVPGPALVGQVAVGGPVVVER